MEKPRLRFVQLWNMNLGFFGIQFGWGLHMANMSAIYEYLGARPDQIPLLWLAAPLTGLVVQPIIGHLSDHTWGRLGRRRPYFLVGAILSSAALLAMPKASPLWMAAGLPWLLTNLGVSGASVAGHAIPPTVKISFTVGAAVFLAAVLWTICTTREYPPEISDQPEER